MSSRTPTTPEIGTLAAARAVADTVVDPELPMLTLADLGVLRSVELDDADGVVATITPTYSGCPALVEMRSDLRSALGSAGFDRVEIRTALRPAWTTDWISERGRRKLAEHGIAPPGSAPRREAGPVPLSLDAPPRRVSCPRCHSAETVETSAFSATACKALRRCESCGEPFEHLKEL